MEAIRNDSWQGVYNATAPNPVSALFVAGPPAALLDGSMPDDLTPAC